VQGGAPRGRRVTASHEREHTVNEQPSTDWVRRQDTEFRITNVLAHAELCRMKRLQQALRRTYLHYAFTVRDQDGFEFVSIALSDWRIHETAQSHYIGLRSCAEGIIQMTQGMNTCSHTRPRACRNRYIYLWRRRAPLARTQPHCRAWAFCISPSDAPWAHPFVKRIGRRLLAATRPHR
jgi:hypothetical protein